MPKDNSALESISPPEQDGFEKFKTAETARLKPAPAQPAADKETPSDSTKAEEKSTKVEEPAGAPDSPKQEPPQDKKPVRKRDAESTIAEKTREIKERDEKLAQMQRELDELKRERSQPKSDATPQVTPPAADKAPAGIMKRSEFREKFLKEHPPVLDPQLTYQEAHQKAVDLADDAYDEHVGQIQQRQQKTRELGERMEKQRLESLKLHPDFDQVCQRAAVDSVVEKLAGPALDALLFHTDSATEILYHLLSNPNDLARITSLGVFERMREIFALSASLGQPPPKEEPRQDPGYPQKVRPISRVPAPQKHVLGGGASPVNEGPDPLDPSFENWRTAEARRTKRA